MHELKMQQKSRLLDLATTSPFNRPAFLLQKAAHVHTCHSWRHPGVNRKRTDSQLLSVERQPSCHCASSETVQVTGSPKVCVRWASEEDASEIAALVQRCGGYWSASELVAECREPRTVLLVAEAVATDKAAQVAGVVLIWCIADEAQVMEVAVSPELQQRGIGYQLLKEALAVSSQSVFTPCMKRLKALTIARKVKQTAGRGAAVLEVMVGNQPAIRLYKKLGFRKVGLRREYYPDGSDAILMRRPIS